MFVSSKKYEEALRSIINEGDELQIAVAFWGRGAESVINLGIGKSFKLICNLRSGATNPDTVDLLLQNKAVQLRQHDLLHAKVIVGSLTALVGSANLSSNGLNLEASEVDGWEEAGLSTQEPVQVEAIRKWFASMWRDARSISDSDLEEARALWKRRRATRITSRHKIGKDGFTLQGLTQSDLLQRQTYLAIYKAGLSDEAKRAYKRKHKELTGKSFTSSNKLPPMYEGWPQLPKDGDLIDIYYGPHGSLRCYGAFSRANFDVKFKYKDGSKGHLAICRKLNTILGQKFRSEEAVILAKDLKPHITDIWNSPLAMGGEDGKVIALADAVRLCG